MRHASFAAALFIVTAFGALVIFRPHFFPALFSAIARPFWRIELAVDLGALSSPQTLLAENEKLKRDLEASEIRLNMQRVLENENTELKAAMGRASSTRLLLAAVLKRPPLAPYDELIIDVGEDRGLRHGDIVYAAGSVPIGRIADVFEQTSRVMLFSSSDEKYEVLIGSSETPATAIGRGGGQYEAELPRDIQISEGDMVTVPSIFSEPFGTVASVLADPASPFQTILFAPPVNIYELRWVFLKAGK